MIVTKTPLRLPLAGGLTDLKSYAHQFGGVTVSMTIDKNVYVIIKGSMDGFSTCATRMCMKRSCITPTSRTT